MKLGFVGAGNMATALVTGVVKGALVEPENIRVFDVDQNKPNQLAATLGITPMATIEEMIDQSQIIVLAVKPNIVKSVLKSNRDRLKDKAIISIAAGWTVDMLKERLRDDTRLLRVMPNTPALCGAGMTALSKKHTLKPDEAAFAEALFTSIGRMLWIDEDKMEAVTGLSGSGPAYVYMFMEGLAEGGVQCGLTWPQAYEMAAQTVIGAGQMLLSTGLHAGALRDMVCSPGGTTIAAVRILEKDGMRGSVMDAVIASCEASRKPHA